MRTAKPLPKQAESFYRSEPWQRLRREVIASRGNACERCGRSDGRIIADHKAERKDGGAALDPLNVELLCIPCHNRKMAKARAARLMGG